MNKNQRHVIRILAKSYQLNPTSISQLLTKSQMTQQDVADFCGTTWITVRDWKRKGYLKPSMRREDGADLFSLESLQLILKNAIGSGLAPGLLSIKRRGPAKKRKTAPVPTTPETAEDYGF
ncbi:hypothetical protein OH491_25970 [Termitidicoccus mucosus]|uniref:Uncharacterized protein n=1 Tax=Termitidicoccus mucosus TaxID=1184151 RepID=A0A178IKC8_9BACT|nr:hypothetical protein AW736_00570 [Opitutaceae bacterium TSB47]